MKATALSSSAIASAGERSLTGLRKAAVFVLLLDEATASDLLRGLADDELERLTAEMARLGVVGRDVLAAVLEEYHDLMQLHAFLGEGGTEQAARLIRRSFPPERSRRLLQLLEAHRSRLPLAFLSRAETDSLLALLEAEHPQTVAVILAHMAPAKAAEVLERMPDARRRDLVQRIAALGATHEEALRELEESLREYLDASLLEAPEGRAGIQAAADILRAGGRGGKEILDDLREEDARLAESIDRRLFAFEAAGSGAGAGERNGREREGGESGDGNEPEPAGAPASGRKGAGEREGDGP